jgi:aryl-alcohol dehydrogenase-like predicted oxidoreductase
VLAYSSLARGFFSGRVTRENFEQARATLDRACLTAYCHEVNFQRLDRAAQFARERGLTVPQVALAYALSSPMDVYPLVGAASGEEFADSARALAVKLTAEERVWLNGGDD